MLRIALCQANFTVGDIPGNEKKIVRLIQRARRRNVDIITFPELAISGYPPEDLLLKPQFIQDNLDALQRIAMTSNSITAIVGFVDYSDDAYNAAAVLHDGRISGVYHKNHLPNYGVFDERRYFQEGERPLVMNCQGYPVGLTICEDIWYPGGPADIACFSGGALLIINISSSPYSVGKSGSRERMLATRAADNVAAVTFTNMVGGQDELVFDGASLVVDHQGKVLARGAQFEEDFIVADLRPEEARNARLHDPRRRYGKSRVPGNEATEALELPKIRLANPAPLRKVAHAAWLSKEAEVYAALVLATRDYVVKNGFSTVLVGLSGGIDSALTAAIAVDALGSDHVIGVAMPSPYSSPESLTDAEALSANLGMKLWRIPIDPAFDAFRGMLDEAEEDCFGGIAEENIQARIRGDVLMTISNARGWLVLATGNKSEMAMGYCTLYGDMVGGFAVLKDIYKTTVYELAAYRNTLKGKDIVPQSIIEKPPSAELKPGQLDSDTLPPYPVLDPILRGYIEEELDVSALVDRGVDGRLAGKIIEAVDRSEYKRRQGPPGIKVTMRAFGKDRRLPITNLYRPNRNRKDV